MKKFYKFFALLFCAVCICANFSCAKNEIQGEKATINFGVLKGPTGIGSVYLMQENELDNTANHYNFTLASEATEIVSLVASGSLDIAAIPTNVAATLYNKTSGEVKMLALNTAGVLYILEKGNTVASISSLKGKTIYAVGQGSNPEFVLNYILTNNGLTVGTDVFVEFLDSSELQTRAASGLVDICMLPVPAVTVVLSKNQDMRIALDLTAEWENLNTESRLIMGCVIARNDFFQANKETVKKFLTEYEASINYVKANPSEAGEMCEKYEIVPSKAIATKAIPDSNLLFISGSKIQNTIQGYYQVLFKAEPKSIGGALPKDDFYITE